MYQKSRSLIVVVVILLISGGLIGSLIGLRAGSLNRLLLLIGCLLQVLIGKDDKGGLDIAVALLGGLSLYLVGKVLRGGGHLFLTAHLLDIRVAVNQENNNNNNQ